MKKRTLFGAYEPDKPPHLQDGLIDMANAYPKAGGYGPVGSFVPTTDALPGGFNGGDAFVASDENGTLYAGTPTDLYRFSAGSWINVASGFGLSQRWAFTQFGDYAIAINGAATQVIDLLAGTAGALSGGPTATSVATVRDFVVYGGANGNAALVQWSGFNNHTANTPGVNQAGYQPMLDGGDVMGVASGEYGLIIQRNAVRRMTYTGDQYVWQFDVLAPNVGAMSRGSIAQAGRRVYFLSDRGFMFCDGSDVTPIGNERVDATFFALHGRSELSGMYAAIDPRRTTVAWLVPGSPGRVWIYNWQLDRWSIVEIGAKAMFSGFTTNVPLEALDALYPGGLESVPYSLDDPRFAGGDPLLLLVDVNNRIGTLTGASMAARFVTPLDELIDGRAARLRRLRPISDAIDDVVATIDARQRLGDESGVTSFAEMQRSGDMPARASGRYFSTTMEIQAGAQWSYTLGIEHTVELGGAR